MRRNRCFAWLLLISCSLGVAHAEDPRDPYKFFFNETWGDFHEELNNAKAQGKQGIMIFFEMNDCPFCHYMKTNVLNRPAVQAYYRQHFLLFSVDIEGDLDIKDMQGKSMKQKDFAFREHRVRATPVIAFFDLNGKKTYHHVGKTTGVEEFMQLGEYVVSGAYQTMPFIRYKQSLQQTQAKDK
ncbi:MAG: thioredoxin fold domain-containing protein [Gammaproteobacteria bacterium]|nr:thioredoxin fold domain-containing protein [Gammaproteobacteria bacterium]